MINRTKEALELASRRPSNELSSIERALVRSQSYDEIGKCTAGWAEINAFVAEAEGSCDLVSQYGYVDVWGTDDDGGEYRLHITPEEEAAYAADRAHDQAKDDALTGDR